MSKFQYICVKILDNLFFIHYYGDIELLHGKIGRLTNSPERLRPTRRSRDLLLGGDKPKAERRNATRRKMS